MHRRGRGRVEDKENLHFNRKAVPCFLGSNIKCPFVITVLKFSCVQKPPMNMDLPYQKIGERRRKLPICGLALFFAE